MMTSTSTSSSTLNSAKRSSSSSSSSDLMSDLTGQAIKRPKLDMEHLCIQASKMEKMESSAKSLAKQKKLSGSSNDIWISNPSTIKLNTTVQNYKRQRSGPSCDCCRSRKIKCDSEIGIISEIPESAQKLEKVANSKSLIANCEIVSINWETGYQYYRISKDSSTVGTEGEQFNFLQFKPCMACTNKNLQCNFSKGFTRNDIIKFNKSIKLGKQQDDHKYGGYQQSPKDKEQQSAKVDVKIENSNESLPTPSPTPATTAKYAGSITTQLPPLQPQHHQHQQQQTPPSQQQVLVQAASDEPSRPTVSSDNVKKSTKKTSCKSCRTKKIKCVRAEGANTCVHCFKKSQVCES